MIGLIIKWVVIFLVAYYVSVFIWRIVLPFYMIYRKMNTPEARREREEMFRYMPQNRSQYGGGASAEPPRETVSPKKGRIPTRDGDYIDFEEVK